MTLGRMADVCGGIYYGREEDRDREVCAITTDSRKAEPGCLFAAIKGERVDGHDFVGQVFGKGALCVIGEQEPEFLCSSQGVPVGQRASDDSDALTDVKNGIGNSGKTAGSFSDAGDGARMGNYIKVESTIKALGDLAAYYLEQLSIPVVGITGSVGKTSTKEMVAAVLSQKYRTLKTAGNFNNELGLPLTIFRLREEDQIAVLEMGINHFGEMHNLARIAKPDTCVITNIGQCHLEFLGDRDGVLRAKTEIFDFLRPDGHIILNGDDDKLASVEAVEVPARAGTQSERATETGDDPRWADVSEQAAGICEKNVLHLTKTAGLGTCGNSDAGEIDSSRKLRPTFFGFGQENDIYADHIVKKGLDGIECRICVAGKAFEAQTAKRLPSDDSKNTGDSHTMAENQNSAEPVTAFTVQIPIPGIHMVMNALAATAVGLHYGLTFDEIRAGIESLQPVSGRFHIIHTEQFTIIDDCYNANPMSMKASLEVLQDGLGRKVAILGDMGELGGEEEQMHRGVGEAAGGMDIDLCICVGPLSAQIAAGVNAVNAGMPTVTLPNLQTLLAQLGSLVKKGDTILVKASHFMHFEKVVAKLEEMG
ncbi:MAG: UDP-N-acetylmuramoyl-tripeptide--D-alanyl-D-alanine ligase [Lachnospiraceae bacterium]|nr:UDP-N-acetylmuramoyl-tripeptide--D-alanyl-D-alanine ligase [Lachnospiraceae bacterium]